MLVAGLSAGQTVGGVLRPAAVLLPRGRSYGDGPNDFQINRTPVAAGVTAEKFPTFSAANPPRDQPDARLIAGRATEMSEGQFSDFMPTANGGLVLHIDKRLPIDEAAFEKERLKLAEQFQQQKGEAAFEDWLRERRTLAHIQTAKG